MKPILHLCLLMMLLFSAAAPSYAQRWKKPMQKAAKKAAQKEQSLSKKVLPAITENQIRAASKQAGKIWKLNQINAALDKKALAAWAVQQGIRPQSPAYQQEAKQLAFIRLHAEQIQATFKRDFIHVNSVNYTPFIKEKNKILLAANWTPGSQAQIIKLIKTLNAQNPQSKIIVASPFFPPTKQPYSSGQYSRFHRENGADPFFKELLHQPNLLFVTLNAQAGLPVKNQWESWMREVSPYYSQNIFGKTKDILVFIAPARFIEGNAAFLKQGRKGISPWNKDQILTLSIRTQKENNLTDFKWDLITSRGKTPLPAPYTSGWILNAFVDRIDPQFSPILGTDVIIRIHPQLSPQPSR